MISISPKVPEAIRRQFGVAHRMLDVAMAKVCLEPPRIVPFVRQREAAGVSQHVRVGFEAEASRRTSALYKPRKARRGERRAALGHKHEWRLWFLLSLEPAKGSQSVATDGMRSRRPLLDAPDGQRGAAKINLIPAQVYQLARSQAVLVGHLDHGGVAVSPSIGTSHLHQALDFGISQILAGPQFGVRPADRHCDCSFYSGRRYQIEM